MIPYPILQGQDPCFTYFTLPQELNQTGVQELFCDNYNTVQKCYKTADKKLTQFKK